MYTILSRCQVLAATFLITTCTSNYNNTSWTTYTSPNDMPVPYSDLIVGFCSLTNKIWLLGGWDIANAWGRSSTSFDILSETFTPHAPLPVDITIESQLYTQIHDTIYMAIQDTFASFNMTTAIFVNNLNNDAIPIPIPSGNGDWGLHGCLTNIGDQFLVVLGGGYNEGTTFYDTVHIYDIYNDLWISNAQNMKQKRGGAFSCNSHRDYVYAIGGYHYTEKSHFYINTVEKLYIGDFANIGSYSWTYLIDTLSVARGWHRSIVVNDDIYVLGGCTDVFDTTTQISEIDIIETYNNDRIHTDIHMDYALASVAAIFVDNRIYLMGGYNDADIYPSIIQKNEKVTSSWQTSSIILSDAPTQYPTILPSDNPSHHPSTSPSDNPSNTPTQYPTQIPTFNPTNKSSEAPTGSPSTNDPSERPSLYPSVAPFDSIMAFDKVLSTSVIIITSDVTKTQNDPKSTIQAIPKRANNGFSLTLILVIIIIALIVIIAIVLFLFYKEQQSVKKQANNAMMGAYEKDDKVMVVENAQIVEKEAGEQYVVKENNETEMGTMEGPQIGRDEFIVEDNIITPIGNEVSHESRSVEIMEGVDARKSFVVVHRDDETPIEGPQINRDEFIIHAQEEIISLQ